MTMKKPYPGIIRSERNGQVAAKWQQRHVPSGRVVEVEGLDARVDVVGFGALGESGEVVAVQVDRVVGWGGCLPWDIL